MLAFSRCVLILGFALPSSGVNASSGQDWLAKLHTPDNPSLHAEAAGYALGVLEGSAATAGIIDTKGLSAPRRPCPPEDATATGIAGALAIRLQARSDWQALPAPVALLLAGLEVFPCRPRYPQYLPGEPQS